MATDGRTSTKRWRVLRNLADGSCGIYASLQAFMILRGVHPRHAENAFASNKATSVRHLVRLCREATVKACESARDPDTRVPRNTTGARARARDNEELSPIGFREWKETILNEGGEGDRGRGWYDQRAILLLLECLGIKSQVQLVVKSPPGRYSSYRDAGGPATPPPARVLIEWIGGCHFGVVVHNVRWCTH